MFHVSKSWKESKNSGAVFGKCFHRNGCGLIKNKGFKITEKYWNIKNAHFEPAHRNLFRYRNSENAKVFKYFRKFLSEDLTESWPMPEMNHLSTTREGHLNHLIFRLFIKMKKKSRMILNWVKSQLNRKIKFLSNFNPSLTLLDSKNDTDHVILVIQGSVMVSQESFGKKAQFKDHKRAISD